MPCLHRKAQTGYICITLFLQLRFIPGPWTGLRHDYSFVFLRKQILHYNAVLSLPHRIWIHLMVLIKFNREEVAKMWESQRFHRSWHHREPFLMLLGVFAWRRSIHVGMQHQGASTKQKHSCFKSTTMKLGHLCVRWQGFPLFCHVPKQCIIGKTVDQIRGNVKEVTEQAAGQLMGRFQVPRLTFCCVSWLINTCAV